MEEEEEGKAGKLRPPLAGVRKERDERSGDCCRATAGGSITSDDQGRDGRMDAVFEGPVRRRTGRSSS